MPKFPTTPGSLIRATTAARTTPSLFMLTSDDDAGETYTIWIHQEGGRYNERELTLVEVVHDEARTVLMASVPTWGELTDIDKGCALMHAWKVENEGRDYAVDNYPAKFIDHPVLVKLTDDEASEFVARLHLNLGWADKVSVGDGEMSWDEFHRLYNLALDSEATR